MGILNFLTQSNPILIKIISLPFCIIITILSIKVSIHFLNKASTKKQTIFFCTINASLMILIFIEYFLLNSKNNMIITPICLFTIMYLIVIELIFIKRYNEIENSSEKIKSLELDNKTLTTKYDELSAFHHDFNNIIQTIGGLLFVGKYDNLKKYYKGLKVDCQTLNDMEKFNTQKINNPEILALLLNKYELAKQNGIRINLEIFSDLSKLNSDIFQIIRILGILLDNAIEANKDCIEKILNIELKQEENKQIIIIENSYSNKDVSTNTIFQKGFSTKKGNRGLGLWKVNKIINHNKNINLHTYKSQDLFTQQLEIYI